MDANISRTTSSHSGGSEGTSRQTYATGGESRFEIETTQPERLLRHDISDEELEILANNGSDGLSQAIWAFFGATLGALLPAADALYQAYWVRTAALTVLGLLSVLILVVGLVLVVGGNVVSRNRGSTASSLVREIRSRGRH